MEESLVEPETHKIVGRWWWQWCWDRNTACWYFKDPSQAKNLLLFAVVTCRPPADEYPNLAGMWVLTLFLGPARLRILRSPKRHRKEKDTK